MIYPYYRSLPPPAFKWLIVCCSSQLPMFWKLGMFEVIYYLNLFNIWIYLILCNYFVFSKFRSLIYFSGPYSTLYIMADDIWVAELVRPYALMDPAAGSYPGGWGFKPCTGCWNQPCSGVFYCAQNRHRICYYSQSGVINNTLNTLPLHCATLLEGT